MRRFSLLAALVILVSCSPDSYEAPRENSSLSPQAVTWTESFENFNDSNIDNPCNNNGGDRLTPGVSIVSTTSAEYYSGSRSLQIANPYRNSLNGISRENCEPDTVGQYITYSGRFFVPALGRANHWRIFTFRSSNSAFPNDVRDQSVEIANHPDGRLYLRLAQSGTVNDGRNGVLDTNEGRVFNKNAWNNLSVIWKAGQKGQGGNAGAISVRLNGVLVLEAGDLNTVRGGSIGDKNTWIFGSSPYEVGAGINDKFNLYWDQMQVQTGY